MATGSLCWLPIAPARLTLGKVRSNTRTMRVPADLVLDIIN